MVHIRTDHALITHHCAKPHGCNFRGTGLWSRSAAVDPIIFAGKANLRRQFFENFAFAFQRKQEADHAADK
jgi:hypothetical protein